MKTAKQFHNPCPNQALQSLTAKQQQVGTMKKQKLFAGLGLGHSKVELMVLYALTATAAIVLMDLHWLLALSVAPGVMLATMFGTLVVVQVLWMLVVGMERLGTAVGLRKSPLA
jgi:hypothetical protein